MDEKDDRSEQEDKDRPAAHFVDPGDHWGGFHWPETASTALSAIPEIKGQIGHRFLQCSKDWPACAQKASISMEVALRPVPDCEILQVRFGKVPLLSNLPVSPPCVRIAVLASPINPADASRIDGAYPHSGGNVCGGEGAGRVVESESEEFTPGDLVIPAKSAMGWWRREMLCGATDLIKVPTQLSPMTASMLYVNPPTAYRMLRDFVRLNPGEWVIQNGANSAVGRAVIQLCKQWGLKTVNIVRDRPNYHELEQELLALGADRVVKAEQLDAAIAESGFPQARLGLNCVSGILASDMTKLMVESGVMVTYGGMSKKSLVVSVGQQIFRDITLRGFWVSRWYAKARHEDKQRMLEEIVQLYQKGVLVDPPIAACYGLEQWRDALDAAAASRRQGKILFKLA